MVSAFRVRLDRTRTFAATGDADPILASMAAHDCGSCGGWDRYAAIDTLIPPASRDYVNTRRVLQPP